MVPNLLYVIGVPKRYSNEHLLSSFQFFGQFGVIKRILVNSFTKDYYEQQGQCAVYVWYEDPINVVLALACLNGLKIPSYGQAKQGYLKCSFGTSKYCVNFLKESKCETASQPGQHCPFLHGIEHRRDKVIQDDFEFKDFIGQQDRICSDFLKALGIQALQNKNLYLPANTKGDILMKMGLPSVDFIFGMRKSQI